MEAALTDCPDGCGRRTCVRRGAHGSGPTEDCTVQPRGSWLTTPCLAWTTTSRASLSRGSHRNPLTRTPGPFPTACSRKAELLGYIDWCRGGAPNARRARRDAAARPLPSTHRYHGMLFECLSAACRCTSLSTPPRSVSPHRRRRQAATAPVTNAMDCAISTSARVCERAFAAHEDGPLQCASA
jgi:hypothetical protein